MSNMMSQCEDLNKEYDWEEGLVKTWEAVPMDSKNNKNEEINPVSSIIKKDKQLRLEEKMQQNRLGLMRKLFIMIDFSDAMIDIDFEPSRLDVTLKYLGEFVPEFISANPLSQLAIIELEQSAHVLSNMSGNCAQHLKKLKKSSHNKSICKSEISILNGLQLALKTLRATPRYFTREIIIIMGALGTCDPGDLNKTIKVMAEEGIRVSVISLSAEIHICTELTRLTKGSYSVVLNEKHFYAELIKHVDPPKAMDKQEKVLIRAGFPHIQISNQLLQQCGKRASDYECPQCSSKCNELPCSCSTCGLMLVTVPQLARSYQHLFPVKAFTEIAYNAQVALCFACQKEFSMKNEFNIYRCDLCEKFFCTDCNIFIHETLHCCVGCSCTYPSH